MLFVEPAHYAEAAQFGHGNIQKQDVRPEGADGIRRFTGVADLAYHLVLSGNYRTDRVARDGAVVDNQ
jgi:hypothetical protein